MLLEPAELGEEGMKESASVRTIRSAKIAHVCNDNYSFPPATIRICQWVGEIFWLSHHWFFLRLAPPVERSLWSVSDKDVVEPEGQAGPPEPPAWLCPP